jgi:hypothetical protein
MLFVLCGVQVMAQTDYYVAHGADVNVSHSTHYPKTISIVGTQSEEQVLTNIASSIHCPAYFDKTSTIFEVLAGDLVTPNIIINGAWMHGYVYVDWNNNKQFDVNIQGDGPYTKGDNNELMCWSLYSKNGNGDTGWNSDGAYQSSGNVLAPGSFYVPADLEVGSVYRMRYKVEWNSIDPAGSGDKFLTDGGAIIDVMLKIAGKATKVEKYPLNDYMIKNSAKITEINQINDNLYQIKVTKPIYDFNTNTLLGVQVLSMSKRIMNEVMTTAEDLDIKIFYQDTDSMHIEKDKLDFQIMKTDESRSSLHFLTHFLYFTILFYFFQ